jgi:SAM-dependent methyltransferase
MYVYVHIETIMPVTPLAPDTRPNETEARCGQPAPKGPPPLDWNDRWRKALAAKGHRGEKPSHYWNRRAPSFSRRGLDNHYARTFLDLLAPQPHWSVLDVGCGTGTLAIPLAARVARVTAMDFSEAMLEHLVRRCEALGLANVHARHAGWEDDWDVLGIGTHDVVIASRSLTVEDLEGAIRKMDRAARHRACITSIVGEGPRDRCALEAVGRPFAPGPDYLYVYNLLHQIGIFADITIITAEDERTFADPADALEVYQAMIGNLDEAEDARLRGYLSRELIQRGGKWVLRHAKPIQWAVITWEKAPNR